MLYCLKVYVTQPNALHFEDYYLQFKNAVIPSGTFINMHKNKK